MDITLVLGPPRYGRPRVPPLLLLALDPGGHRFSTPPARRRHNPRWPSPRTRSRAGRHHGGLPSPAGTPSPQTASRLPLASCGRSRMVPALCAFLERPVMAAVERALAGEPQSASPITYLALPNPPPNPRAPRRPQRTGLLLLPSTAASPRQAGPHAGVDGSPQADPLQCSPAPSPSKASASSSTMATSCRVAQPLPWSVFPLAVYVGQASRRQRLTPRTGRAHHRLPSPGGLPTAFAQDCPRNRRADLAPAATPAARPLTAWLSLPSSGSMPRPPPVPAPSCSVSSAPSNPTAAK